MGFPKYPGYPGYPRVWPPKYHRNGDDDRATWRDLSGFKRDATVTNPFTAGYLNTSDTAQNIGADTKLGFRVYIATPMTVTKFTAYLDNTGTGHAACNVRAVLYADVAGEPGALVAAGTPLAIADNMAVEWKDLAISASLTPGWYWMFLHGDATAAGLNARINTSGTYSAVRYNSDAYSDGPSDPAGACTSVNGRLCLYLTSSDFGLWTGAGTPVDPYALTLNGSTQFAQTAAFAQTGGQWTIEAWALNLGQRISYSGNSMPLAHGYISADGWYWRSASAAELTIQMNRAGAAQPISLAGGMAVGVWTHLVFRCNNAGLTGQWSKNGAHQAAVALDAAMVPCTSRPFYVGAYNAGTQYCAPWRFAAVRYYNRLLSDAEVEAHYAAGPHGTGYVKTGLALDLNAARSKW